MNLSEFASSARAALTPLETKQEILPWVFSQPGLVARSGTWCEFGVHGGGTLRRIARECGAARLWGFDSFRGLPETWNDAHKKGMFARSEPIMPPEGVNLMVGWYEDTLSAFWPPDPITFAFIDCDLYSSANTVLNHIGPVHHGGRSLFAPEAVIVLDDFFTPPFENGVMRAFFEHFVEHNVPFEWLAKAAGGDIVAVKIRPYAYGESK